MPSVATLKSRELSPETFIPYVRHVDETTVALDSRTLMVMVAVSHSEGCSLSQIW